MTKETGKPSTPEYKTLEFWAGATRGLSAIWACTFVGFVGGVVLGFIDENKAPIVPLIAFLFTFCLAVPLSLLVNARKAIADLQTRVSELEKR